MQDMVKLIGWFEKLSYHPHVLEIQGFSMSPSQSMELRFSMSCFHSDFVTGIIGIIFWSLTSTSAWLDCPTGFCLHDSMDTYCLYFTSQSVLAAHLVFLQLPNFLISNGSKVLCKRILQHFYSNVEQKDEIQKGKKEQKVYLRKKKRRAERRELL